MLKEFKEFALKGNVMDMAIGVIIGGAFGKIITSLVNDVIMPLVSILTGGYDFKTLKYIITPADEVAGIAETSVNYGMFIQNIIDFLIIAFCIFMMVKSINKVSKKKVEEVPEEVKKPTTEEILLDIKGLLEKKSEKKN